LLATDLGKPAYLHGYSVALGIGQPAGLLLVNAYR